MCYLKFDGSDKVYLRRELNIEHNISTPLPILDPDHELQVLIGNLTEIKQVAAYVAITGDAFIPHDIIDKREKTFKLGLIVNSLNLGLTSLAAGVKRSKVVPRIPAVFIKAKLNGYPIQGWIGFAKFEEGDEVKVVVSRQQEHDEVYAILRPKDNIISIMPSCQQGHKAGTKTITKSILSGGGIFCFILSFIAALVSGKTFLIFLGSFIGTMIFSSILMVLAGRSIYKDTKNGLYYFAERIFTALGWVNPEYIDLKEMNQQVVKRLLDNHQYPHC